MHLTLSFSAGALPILAALSGLSFSCFALSLFCLLSPGEKDELRAEAMPSTINELNAVMNSSARGAQLTLKQLALLVHPDKSEHPRAWRKCGVETWTCPAES